MVDNNPVTDTKIITEVSHLVNTEATKNGITTGIESTSSSQLSHMVEVQQPDWDITAAAEEFREELIRLNRSQQGEISRTTINRINARVRSFRDFERRLNRNWDLFWQTAREPSNMENANEYYRLVEAYGPAYLYVRLYWHMRENVPFELQGSAIETYSRQPRHIKILYPSYRDQRKFFEFYGITKTAVTMPRW